MSLHRHLQDVSTMIPLKLCFIWFYWKKGKKKKQILQEGCYGIFSAAVVHAGHFHGASSIMKRVITSCWAHFNAVVGLIISL